MHKTTENKGYALRFIFSYKHLADLKEFWLVSYDRAISACGRIINLISAVSVVTIDNAYLRLDRKTDNHLYFCGISQYSDFITVLEDDEIVLMDTKGKLIKIPITYTREVSTGSGRFRSVMDRVGKLCEAQPQLLNCGSILSGINIAIADK